MTRSSIFRRSQQLARRIDRFCGRINDGLTAVAIVLTVIACLTIAYRSAEALRVPERFEIAATT